MNSLRNVAVCLLIRAQSKELEGSLGLRQVITSTNYGPDSWDNILLQQEAKKQFGANLKNKLIVGINLWNSGLL